MQRIRIHLNGPRSLLSRLGTNAYAYLPWAGSVIKKTWNIHAYCFQFFIQVFVRAIKIPNADYSGYMKQTFKFKT